MGKHGSRSATVFFSVMCVAYFLPEPTIAPSRQGLLPLKNCAHGYIKNFKKDLICKHYIIKQVGKHLRLWIVVSQN